MKDDLLRVFASLNRKYKKEFYHLSEIYTEYERLTNKKVVNNGASIRRTLESYCKDSDSFSNKGELFILKEEDAGYWKSKFYNNFIKIDSLKKYDILSEKDLMDMFKVTNQGGIRKSKRTYSIVLVSDENGIYNDSEIVNGRLIYSGHGTKTDQLMKSGNLLLANSIQNDIPLYFFKKVKKSVYCYQGKFILDGLPYQELENGILVYKFPLRLIDYVEEDYTSYEKYSEVVNSVLKISEDINVYSISNDQLKFVDGPVKIRKYNNTEKRKSNRTSKPDYIADEIIKTIQGEITEKKVYEYELNKVMQYEVVGLVDEMIQFFENKKDNEGYDVLSFDIDEDRNIRRMYIDVKSTKGVESTPIDITSDELKFAKKNLGNYYIYRVIKSDSVDRYVKVIKGEELFNDFEMLPSSYRVYGK